MGVDGSEEKVFGVAYSCRKMTIPTMIRLVTCFYLKSVLLRFPDCID